MTDDSNGSHTRLTRRGYLGALGATSAAVLAGATEVGSAAGHGYGASGYGAGQYGGDGTVTEPTLAVTTVGASSVDTTSATFAGELTGLSNVDSASVYFEWGPSSEDLPEATPEQTLGATGGFEATVEGLQADTEYVFRAVATAGDAVDTGTEATLRTDSADDPEPTEGTPEIVNLAGADVSNANNPHVDAEVQWEATIDASELYAAELVLSDHEGRIDSWSYELSGDTASATETARIPHRAGEQDIDYTAELVVYSYYGNTDTRTTTFQAQ
jgi:hypothetical protein